jgi:pseudouridine kinase
MTEQNLSDDYVVVIGAAGVDSKGRAAAPLIHGTSNPGMVRVSVGGVARNVADNLARLGVETVLLSAIGDDGSGRRVLTAAAEVGINTDYCLFSDAHRTSAYLAVLDESGNLVMSVDDMSILACITPAVIEERHDLIRQAAIVVLDSNLLPETIEAIFKITQRYNIPVCADPTSTLLATRLKPYLPQIRLITPNIAEAQILADCSIQNETEAMAAARRLVNAGVKLAVITLAEMGVVYATASASGHVPARAAEVVDLTGASDALTASIVFGLLNGIPTDESIRLGVSAAALTLTSADSVYRHLSLELLYDSLVI